MCHNIMILIKDMTNDISSLCVDADYEVTVSNLTWLGPRCMDLDDWNSPAEAEGHVARWRKTMNLSISCFITALIIFLSVPSSS